MAEEKQRVETFYEFGETLAGETDARRLREALLREIADLARAEVATLYSLIAEREDAFVLMAARGVETGLLDAEIRPGSGLAGRALAEGRTVATSYPGTGLTVPALGENVAIRHELHVPLRAGELPIGVWPRR